MGALRPRSSHGGAASATRPWWRAYVPSTVAKGAVFDASGNFWALLGTTGNNVYYYTSSTATWTNYTAQTGLVIAEDYSGGVGLPWIVESPQSNDAFLRYDYSVCGGWCTATTTDPDPVSVAAGSPSTSWEYDVWFVTTAYGTYPGGVFAALNAQQSGGATSSTGIAGPSGATLEEVAMFPGTYTCSDGSANTSMHTAWVMDNSHNVYQYENTGTRCWNGSWTKNKGTHLPSVSHITTKYVMDTASPPNVWYYDAGADSWASIGYPTGSTLVGIGATIQDNGVAAWGSGGNVYTYY
jgi:hypothetical protein